MRPVATVLAGLFLASVTSLGMASTAAAEGKPTFRCYKDNEGPDNSTTFVNVPGHYATKAEAKEWGWIRCWKVLPDGTTG